MLNLNDLKRKRSQIKSKLTRFKMYLNKNDDNPNPIETKVRLDAISNILTEYEDLQGQIETQEDGEIQAEERDAFEDSYFKTVSRAIKLIDSGKVSAANINTTQQRVKLPQLNLPEFYGSYGQWMTFSDTFNSLIDSNFKNRKILLFKNLLKGGRSPSFASG